MPENTLISSTDKRSSLTAGSHETLLHIGPQSSHQDRLRVREHSSLVVSTNVCPTNAVLMQYIRMPSRSYDSSSVRTNPTSDAQLVKVHGNRVILCPWRQPKTQRSHAFPNIFAIPHFQKIAHSFWLPLISSTACFTGSRPTIEHKYR